MLISIRKVFFNLRISLLLIVSGIALLGIQIFNLSQYTERLSALKNQHLLIEKIVHTDLSDPKMASILINGAVSELTLSVKLSGQEAILDTFINSNEEQASLLRSLSLSSQAFQDTALLWSEALAISKESSQERMMSARIAYLEDIGRMIDYQIHVIEESVATAKMTALLLFVTVIIVFFLFRYRLKQIYSDIDKVCSIDTDGSQKKVHTQEIDFLTKHVVRKSAQTSFNPNLIHPSSNLNNEKGLGSAFNAKKAGRSGNTVFLALFEIDQYPSLIQTFSKEDLAGIFKKLGEMITMYEQPLDVIAHMDNDQLVFLMSRSSKQNALEECEKFVHSVEESNFSTAQGIIKITLSGGFMLKPPAKSIDEAINEAQTLIEKSKENGGNRVSQVRERTLSYR